MSKVGGEQQVKTAPMAALFLCSSPSPRAWMPYSAQKEVISREQVQRKRDKNPSRLVPCGLVYLQENRKEKANPKKDWHLTSSGFRKSWRMTETGLLEDGVSRSRVRHCFLNVADANKSLRITFRRKVKCKIQPLRLSRTLNRDHS